MDLVILGASTEGSVEQLGFCPGTAWVWIPAFFQRTNNLSALQYFYKCKVNIIASTPWAYQEKQEHAYSKYSVNICCLLLLQEIHIISGRLIIF